MRARPMQMTASIDAVVGLALVAHETGRDLQRAARTVGGPRALWALSDAGLADLLRIENARRGRIAEARTALARARTEVRERGTTVVPVGDASIPERVRQTFDPPFGLFVDGAWGAVAAALDEAPVVAIVGSRRPTAAGARFAEELAGGLAERGAVVVSGLAAGIDAAAHRGAIRAGGMTVAVLGCGLADGYPRANAALRERIVQCGAVLSEYWLHTPPAPWRFPARNRIVAGLSHAVVVVEAGERSGALITSDFALEAGRPVLAVPGSPWAAVSQGCNALIRMGAAVCCGVADVVDETPHPGWHDGAPSAGGAPVDGMAADVHRLLGEAPRRADELAGLLNADSAAVAAALALLEMEGHAVRGEGQRYWATPGAA